MNIYRAARTRKSAKRVTRWSIEVRANSREDAANIASERLRPKAGQAVWTEYLRKIPLDLCAGAVVVFEQLREQPSCENGVTEI